MYSITEKDIEEMEIWLDSIQGNLNELFTKEQEINNLPEETIIISKILGKICRKIDLIKHK